MLSGSRTVAYIAHLFIQKEGFVEFFDHFSSIKLNNQLRQLLYRVMATVDNIKMLSLTRTNSVFSLKNKQKNPPTISFVLEA